MGQKTLRPIKNQNNIRVKSKSIAGKVHLDVKHSPRNFNPSTQESRERTSVSVFTKRKYSQIQQNASENVSKKGIDDIIKLTNDQDFNNESNEMINLKV